MREREGVEREREGKGMGGGRIMRAVEEGRKAVNKRSKSDEMGELREKGE